MKKTIVQVSLFAVLVIAVFGFNNEPKVPHNPTANELIQSINRLQGLRNYLLNTNIPVNEYVKLGDSIFTPVINVLAEEYNYKVYQDSVIASKQPKIDSLKNKH